MPFQCTKCIKEFSRRASLRNHMRIHNDIIEKLLQEIAKERESPIEIENDQLEIGICSQLEDDEGGMEIDSQLEDDEGRIEINSKLGDDDGEMGIGGDNEGGTRIDNQLSEEDNYNCQIEDQQENQLAESEISEISDISDISEMEESSDQVMVNI